MLTVENEYQGLIVSIKRCLEVVSERAISQQSGNQACVYNDVVRYYRGVLWTTRSFRCLKAGSNR